MNLVIGFGPSLGLALWPRAKPIKSAEAAQITKHEKSVKKFRYTKTRHKKKEKSTEKIRNVTKQITHKFTMGSDRRK